MVPLATYQVLEVCKNAAGVAGNIFAIGLFVSPIPTFRRILRNQATEHFSGLPYIYALLNCLICAWYGSPFVSPDNLLVTTVNSAGAIFQMAYTILFITHAEKTRKLKMLGLLLAVFGVFGIIVVGSLLISDFEFRHLAIGFLSCGTLISMFASPLFVINLVIRTRSVEYMPFYLSLSTFLMSTAFCLYGIFSFDPFICIPNGIGTLLAVIQLVLFAYYKNAPGEHSREPLLESYA